MRGFNIKALLLAIMFAFSFMASSSPASAQYVPPPATAPPPGSGSGSGSFGQWFGGLVDPFQFDGNGSFESRKAGALEKLQSGQCWPCSIFKSFAGGVFRSIQVADSESRSLIPVLTGFATVFALFYLGSAFVSGDAGDLLGRWQVFWRLCIGVAAASTILQAGASSFVWDNFYSLLFSIGTAVAEAFGTAGAAGNCPGLSGGAIASGAQEALTSMAATVCGGYNMSLEGIATGLAMMTQIDGFINTLIFIVAGISLVAIYALLVLTFPLRFIDVLIRLAIVSMLTPILVVAAVFKPTRGYASIAVSNVLNATALFAIVSIIFRIGDTVVKEFLQSTNVSAGQVSNHLFAGNSDPGTALLNAVILVSVALIFLGMLRSAPSIASEFSRSSGGSSAAGDAAVSAATAPVRAVAGGAGLAAGGAAAMKARSVAASTRQAENASQAQAIGGQVAAALGKNAR